MGSLLGKVALVTGASRGIGREIAIDLAKEGASVIVNFSKDIIGAEETYSAVSEQGSYCKLIKGDVSSYSQCKNIIDEVINSFGKIDILINNAGKSHIGLFMDETEEDITSLLNVNLLGPMFLSKLALSDMVKRNYGVIINISSIWGEAGASCEVVYSTSKGGLNLFTKALAKEVAPFGIRVNGVAPGVIDTAMNAFLAEDEKNQLIEEIPQGRFGDPQEIAQLVSFLCNDKCKYLNGQIIRVDGGLL